MYWSQVRVLAGPPKNIKNTTLSLKLLSLIIFLNLLCFYKIMNLKIKVLPKYAYLASSSIAFIFFCYFAYKAFIAYLIHKELYGDGMDVLVSLRAALAGIMFLLILLFFQFIKIKDLKSQRTILRGIFIAWSSLFIILIIVNANLIYFISLSGIAALINLISLFSLVDLIKEERNTLTEKEIYLLQKLANKK